MAEKADWMSEFVHWQREVRRGRMWRTARTLLIAVSSILLLAAVTGFIVAGAPANPTSPFQGAATAVAIAIAFLAFGLGVFIAIISVTYLMRVWERDW